MNNRSSHYEMRVAGRFLCAFLLVSLSLAADKAWAKCEIELPPALTEGDVPSMESANGNMLRWGGDKFAWMGTGQLAALLPKDGIWRGMGAEQDFRDKSWWWYQGLDFRGDTKPELTIRLTQLEPNQLNVVVHDVTHGYTPDWASLLTLLEFPEAGCWRVEGTTESTSLSFVLQVGESDSRE